MFIEFCRGAIKIVTTRKKKEPRIKLNTINVKVSILMKIIEMIIYVMIAKMRANICRTEVAIKCVDMSLNYNKSVFNCLALIFVFGTSRSSNKVVQLNVCVSLLQPKP